MRCTPLLLLVILLSACVGILPAAEHPRLLFGPADLAALRARKSQDPYASILARIASVGERGKSEWQQSDGAMNCAFMYLMTGEDSWAQKAKVYVEQRLNDNGSQAWAKNIKGLNLYVHGKSVALAYDWCHGAPSWAGFRASVSQKLLAQADFIFSNGGSEQNSDPASNWQANRWSSAGLCYLATDEAFPTDRLDTCFAKMKAWVSANMGEGAGNRGWNSEGRGYTSYPWGHIGPYAIAAKRLRGQDLRSASPDAMDHALWTVYAGACRIVGEYAGQYAFHPDFGDDNPNGGSIAEGSYGMAFHFCPDELKPGLVWWYDRMKGANGDRSWDSSRAGAIYSYLYHPGRSLAPLPPLAIPAWRNAMIDTVGNGMFVFRNRYQDGGDLCAEFYAKLRGNRGHNGPDALGFRIVGHGTLWATGGGRYGPRIDGADAYWRSQNSLYPVDPSSGALSINGNSGSIVGVPLINAAGGGSVVAAIASSNLGVGRHTRRFLADYSPASGADGVWVISDSSDNGRFWQMCSMEPNQIIQNGKVFLITAPGGATLMGTVIHPAAPLFTIGSRQRGSKVGWEGKSFEKNQFIHFSSDDGSYLVVLTAVGAKQQHPRISSLAGSGAANGRLISIGRLQVAIDGDSIAVKGAKP